MAVAALAVMIAAYLTWVSASEAAAPAGCGPASGCAQVLASRWSRWFDVPVGAPAAGVYVAILVAAWFARPAGNPAHQRSGWAMLLALAALAAGAAAWFVALQVLVLRAFCPWCLALHACGIVVAVLVSLGTSRAPDRVTRGRAAALVAAGLLGVGVLVAGQLASAAPKRGMGLSAFSGVTIIPSDHPILGSPDAKHVAVVLADYTCPHCRALRHQLDAALERYGPAQLAVAAVPVPLNADCNDAVRVTAGRQRDACELARIALAVWVADPAKFAEMDRWLFAPARPPAAEAARQHAASLAGAEALERALADPRVDRRIAGNVAMYKAAGAGRLPKLLLPTHKAEGPAEDAEALFSLLETHLGLTAPSTGPTKE